MKKIAITAVILFSIVGITSCLSLGGIFSSDSGDSGKSAKHSSYKMISVKPVRKIIGQAVNAEKNPYCTEWDDDVAMRGIFFEGRTVELSPYKMGKTEVPYWLWEEVYDWALNHGYNFDRLQSSSFEYSGYNDSPCMGADLKRSYDNSNSVFNENHPVSFVSWLECVVWCNAYTEKTLGANHCVYSL